MTRATQISLGSRLRLRRAPVRSIHVSGDTAAFEAVYLDSHQELFRYARSIVRDEHLAEDVLQSVMEKALAALQREERDFELRPWLFRITHNEAISRLRQDKPTAELPDALASRSRGLDEQLHDQAKLDTLWADLQALPDKQRQSLVLRELSGLSHEEIAAVIESTPRNVKQTIFEARRALLECEEGRVMICDDVQRHLSDGDGRVRRGRRMQAHLRSCPDCRAFDRALNDRPHDLRALAPALPVAAAAGLLAQLVPGAKLATGAGTAGAAGAATAGGVATTGGWSLGALGGALATKTAVVAATGVVAVGATGAVVADRAPGPDHTAAPAAGAGAGAASSSGAGAPSGNGSPGSAGVGAVGTTPVGSVRQAGVPATTPNATPQGTTPGSARGEERRAAGQARAAEARTEARDRKAAAGSSGAKGQSTTKSNGKSTNAKSATAKTKTQAKAKVKSPNATSKAKSSTPKPSSSPKTTGQTPAPAAGKGTSGGSSNAPKAPAEATPEAAAPADGASSSAPEQAVSGASKKPEK